jgi:hypothetical protein
MCLKVRGEAEDWIEAEMEPDRLRSPLVFALEDVPSRYVITAG